MVDPVKDYETAADGFARVLAECGDGLDGQSPCADWTGQGVVDHVLGGTTFFIDGFGGTAPEGDDAADLPTRYAALRSALVETISRPGALDAMVPSPIGGEVPGSVMLGIFTTDTLIHTWDLARASGLDVELDAELLERSWEGAKPIESILRQPGIFGPAVEVPEDAPFQARALAFFGRQP